MAVFRITESSVSLVKNDEDRWNGSFASLILECQENDMRIFNAINEDTLLEENKQKSPKSAKDIIAIIINGIKIFGQKLKQLYDNAIIKIKELYSNKISKFAKKFKDEFNPAEYNENKILNMDPAKIPVFDNADTVKSYILTIDIDPLMKKALSGGSKISNEILIDEAFRSTKGNLGKEARLRFLKGQLIAPFMLSELISSFIKQRKTPGMNTASFSLSRDSYKTENIKNHVDQICDRLTSDNESIKIVNNSRKESFKQIDDIIKNAKSSDQSIERARTCLEYSSAYQTVITTIANCNIKFIMAEIKNGVKLLKLIKSACKKVKKSENSDAADAMNATNEAFSMIF